jgi:hypothetical protein
MAEILSGMPIYKFLSFGTLMTAINISLQICWARYKFFDFLNQTTSGQHAVAMSNISSSNISSTDSSTTNSSTTDDSYLHDRSNTSAIAQRLILTVTLACYIFNVLYAFSKRKRIAKIFTEWRYLLTSVQNITVISNNGMKCSTEIGCLLGFIMVFWFRFIGWSYAYSVDDDLSVLFSLNVSH